MKIYYIDLNNMTPQYSYPLISSLQNKSNIKMIFMKAYSIIDEEFYNSKYSVNSMKIPFSFSKNNCPFNKLLKPFFIFADFIYLTMKIDDPKNTVLHFNWLSIPIIEWFFIYLFKSMGCKVILTQHNYLQHQQQKLRIGENRIFHLADTIICLSNFVKTQFSESLQKKITLIPHRNCYENLIADNDIQIDNEKSEYRLVCVGNLKSYKGTDLVIDALEYLIKVKQVNNLYLDIFGFGPKEVENKIQSKIEALSLINNINFECKYLPFTELCDIIKHSTIGLLPYTKATQSGLPYLFASFNKPMIMTNIGGLQEQYDKSICILADSDVESISVKILMLIDRIKNNTINKNHFANYLKNNSWHKTVDEYYGVYAA